MQRNEFDISNKVNQDYERNLKMISNKKKKNEYFLFFFFFCKKESHIKFYFNIYIDVINFFFYENDFNKKYY